MPTREELFRVRREADEELRKMRKQIKRNRRPDAVRQKGWQRYLSEGDYEGLDAGLSVDDDGAFLETQRIMPRGERERRRANLQRAQAVTEEEPPAARFSDVAEGCIRALVVEVSSGLCRVELSGETWVCAPRGSLSATETGMTNIVAVGDQVLVSPAGAGRGVIESVLPRRTVLARGDGYDSHLQQVIVANAEQLLIVASWREPALWLELVDRYLIAAQRGGLASIVCLNKVDLAEDRAACRAAILPYVELGCPTILSSAQTGEGVGELRQALAGRVTVLAGLSGVGKSSLLTAVQPGLQPRVSQVSLRRHEGRHTTTQVTLFRLERGGYVIDTPGVREFGLAGLRRHELARFFPEVMALARSCRFSSCSHHTEPGCAVRQAVEAGHMAASRYDSYVKIWMDLAG